MQSSEFIMLVGVPGSGKSTWTRLFLQNADHPYVVISTDDILDMFAFEQRITYSESWKRYFKQAKRLAQHNFETAISEGRDIIWDQTNMTSAKRSGVLKQVPKAYTKIAMVFVHPEEEISRRLALREAETGKHIPGFVMKEMYKTYEEPTVAEGFDKVLFHMNLVGSHSATT